MTQVKVQRKGMDFDQIAKELKIDVQELKKETMQGMAVEIAVNSPVDSGYYVRNHEVRLRSGSFQANKTKPANAPKSSNPNAARQDGVSNMFADIEALDLSKDTFVFRNAMAYAAMIEAGVTGDVTGNPPVYASAAREAPRIIQEVAQRIAARNR